MIHGLPVTLRMFMIGSGLNCVYTIGLSCVYNGMSLDLARGRVACRTGGLAGPARYKSARAKRQNERESKGMPRALVYRAGPANPPVLQAGGRDSWC